METGRRKRRKKRALMAMVWQFVENINWVWGGTFNEKIDERRAYSGIFETRKNGSVSVINVKEASDHQS